MLRLPATWVILIMFAPAAHPRKATKKPKTVKISYKTLAPIVGRIGLNTSDDKGEQSGDRKQLAKWYDAVPETTYFGTLGAIAIGIGVILAFFTRPVLRLMSGVR